MDINYTVENIAEKTWLITEDADTAASVYMYILEGTQKALLIDTGYGSIPLRQIVEEITPLPVTVLLTHGHLDHIGGSADFERVLLHEKDMECYRFHTSREERRLFGLDDSFPFPKDMPDLIDENWNLDLGERTIRLIHTPGHTPGSVCVLDESRKALYTGDTCCKANVLLNIRYACSLETYYKSICRLLEEQSAYDITWPGHHKKPLSGHDILNQFLNAAEILLSGRETGRCLEVLGKTAFEFKYQDIGILYNAETLNIRKEVLSESKEKE